MAGSAYGTEDHPTVTLLDAVMAFKEDVLKVRLPGFIKVVCK